MSKTLEDIDDQQKKDLNRTKVDAVVFNKKQQLKNHLGYFLHPIETDALGEILSPYIPLTTTA